MTDNTRQLDAQQRLNDLDRAIDDLHNLILPSVIVTVGGTFEDPEMVFTCPWCKAELSREGGVYEMDLSIRHNDITFEPDREGDAEQGGAAAVSQGDGNYDTVCYVATCCTTPVDLPEGWEESWS